MGRKQAGKRKHFFFYLTCIIIILSISAFSGCALKEKQMLMETQDLMIRSDYSLALEKNQQLLEEFPQLGDKALFNMGLIYANPVNPDYNYRTSLKYFKRLTEEFPESKLNNQAPIWMSLLYKVMERGKKIEGQQSEIAGLNDKINVMKKENQIKDKKIEDLQKDNQLKDKKADDLQQQIEKLKEIDLNIQKKKRSVNHK